jgi:hypothetical protein
LLPESKVFKHGETPNSSPIEIDAILKYFSRTSWSFALFWILLLLGDCLVGGLMFAFADLPLFSQTISPQGYTISLIVLSLMGTSFQTILLFQYSKKQKRLISKLSESPVIVRWSYSLDNEDYWTVFKNK